MHVISRRLAVVSCFTALTCAPALVLPASAFAAPIVLGLEGEEDKTADVVTGALRKELEGRGDMDEQKMSLLELKLTMGCDGNDPNCLSEGGSTMGVDEMIYGRIDAKGEGYVIKLERLDVAGKKVVGSTSMEVTPADIGAGKLDGTAKRLIDGVYGVEPEPEPVVPAGPVVTDGGEEPPAKGRGNRNKDKDTDEGTGGDGKIPTWKWIGLGVSGGLMAASVGVAAWSTLSIREGGPIKTELVDAAEASLLDDKDLNDVDPDVVSDLCATAREEPNPDEPGAVRNASMVEICNKGDRRAKVATATWVTTGVFAASTVVFAVLIATDKSRRGGGKNARLDRGVRLGVAPTTDGGFFVGGGMRF